MQIESFSTTPLQTVIPAYLYQQFYDDDDLQGFVVALNAEFQGYLDWFNQTPLSVYTNSTVSGELLDWIGTGLYGIARPVISSGAHQSFAGYAARTPYAQTPYLLRIRLDNSSASLVDDDIYKRVLTWYAYLGDGRNASIPWLRRRIARFIYGFGGTDVPADYLSNISIVLPTLAFSASYATAPYASRAYIVRSNQRRFAAHRLQIIVPNTPASTAFKALVDQGYLALPFQIAFSVLIAS